MKAKNTGTKWRRLTVWRVRVRGWTEADAELKPSLIRVRAPSKTLAIRTATRAYQVRVPEAHRVEAVAMTDAGHRLMVRGMTNLLLALGIELSADGGGGRHEG